MNTTVTKGKLADSKSYNQQLDEQIQSLTESSASMAALLDNSDDVASEAFQDKRKKLAANFNRQFSSPIDARSPTCRSIQIEVLAQVTPIDNTATITSTSLPQVILAQPGNQRANTGEVGNVSPSNLSDQMRAKEHMEVELNTSRLPTNEQHPAPIEEGAGVLV